MDCLRARSKIDLVGGEFESTRPESDGTAAQGRVCRQCGYVLLPGVFFCKSCGAPWTDSSEISNVPARSDEPTIPIEAAVPGAPAIRLRIPPRWPAIRRTLLIAFAAASMAFAVGGLTTGRYGYPVAALTLAFLPAIYGSVAAVRQRKEVRSFARYAVAVVAVTGLSASSFIAAASSCENRLGPGADVSGCDFNHRVLAGRDLRKVQLAGANLNGADLSDAKLDGANLSGADLRGANLSGSSLRKVSLTRAQMTGAAMSFATLDAADMSSAVLVQAQLNDARLVGARFDAATLDAVNLNGADLDRAVLTKATVSGSTLRKTRLTGVNFSGATIVGSDLRDAVLNGATLDGAQLENLRMEGVSLMKATGLPDTMLARGLGVAATGLAETLIRRNIRMESREGIRLAMGAACRGKPVPGAGVFPAGSFHPMVVATSNGSLSQDPSERAWEPMALRFGQLVACVGNEIEETVQLCPYVTLDARRQRRIVTRVRYSRSIKIVAARTATVIANEVVRGGEPNSCPAVTSASTRQFSGDRVTSQEVLRRLGREVR